MSTAPKTLGKYLIRRAIGKGAMGVVYEGFDPVINRVVAIKTIKKDELDAEEAQEHAQRFLIEAKAAGRLNHKNIVGIYDYGEEKGLSFIVMEFVRGKELKSFFAARHPFPLSQIVRLMGELLEALGYSHSRGVVHRDVKPDNIFVTEEGSLKLGDFGVARIDTTSKTHAGTLLGTPSYMAPEQIRGEAADARADLYAAGVILYQFLVGERPFSGGMVAVLQKVMMELPKPPSAHNPQIPEAIDAVVLRALAKAPEDRFASAAEFNRDLAAAVGLSNAEDDAESTIVMSAATLKALQEGKSQPRDHADNGIGTRASAVEEARRRAAEVKRRYEEDLRRGKDELQKAEEEQRRAEAEHQAEEQLQGAQALLKEVAALLESGETLFKQHTLLVDGPDVVAAGRTLAEQLRDNVAGMRALATAPDVLCADTKAALEQCVGDLAAAIGPHEDFIKRIDRECAAATVPSELAGDREIAPQVEGGALGPQASEPPDEPAASLRSVEAREQTMLVRPGDIGALGPALQEPPQDGTMMIRLSSAATIAPGAVSLMVVRSDVASMVGQRFALQAEMRVGRSDAEIVLPDPRLSRQHAVVRCKNTGVSIVDAGSANGTYVNGLRLQPDKEYSLLPGAHVSIGGTVLALSMDSDASIATLAGTEIAGRYVLLECLQSSPKGALYRAQTKGTQLVAAIKLLAPGYCQWAGYRESFEAEAMVAANLQHPHICRLQDYGQAELPLGGHKRTVPFLVYEMMAGGNLTGRLPELGKVPTATLVAWVRDLASALDHVHCKGMVHGGLKPSAICFDADDHIYLTDFAQGRAPSDGLQIFGAPAYMAPELWEGQAVSAASDLYALAVITYQFLAGVLPFEGQEDSVVRARHLKRSPPALHPCAGERMLGPAVTTVMSRALSAEPAQRHSTASDFAQQLARAVSIADRAIEAHTVFISYERASATAWVTLIAQELAREHGIRCFVDAASLDRAESTRRRIRSAIRDCEVFICILGATTLQSQWVRDEIAMAWQARKTMVPVLLEGFRETSEDKKARSIRVLLDFGGELILDRQNLYVKEAIQRIAQRVKSGLADRP